MTYRWILVASISLVPACAGSSSAEGGGGTGAPPASSSNGSQDGGTPEGATSRPRATHFASEPVTFTLPGVSMARALNYFDVDGDGWLDGMIVDANDGCNAFGTSDADAHYRLFANDGKKFAPESKYELPYLGVRCATPKYGFDDLDGDGAPDFFDRDLGQLRRGSASGFGAPTPWNTSTLPPSSDLKQVVVYKDIDGDKLADAVVTDEDKLWVEGGKVFLRVARNDGSGFGALETYEVAVDDVASRPITSFIDFNGDGRVDLISDDGKDGFRVWFNDGARFGPATKFALPSSCACIGDETSNMELVDLDGDGQLDLVEPADLRSLEDNKTVLLEVWGRSDGKPFWKVYRNEGKAFATDPIQWPVPIRTHGAQGAITEGFNGISDTHPIAGMTGRWFTKDFNGDHLVDLIEADNDAGELRVYYGTP